MKNARATFLAAILVFGGSLSVASTPNSRVPCSGVDGVKHPLGGGFVASTAKVADTVALDSASEVCGTVKILNSGKITNSRIRGSGIIRNTGTITGATIDGYVLIMGNKDAGEVTIENDVIGPLTITKTDDRSEWVRLSGNVTVRGPVRGRNISLANGAVVESSASVIGSNIDIQEARVSGPLTSCTDLKKETRSRNEDPTCAATGPSTGAPASAPTAR